MFIRPYMYKYFKTVFSILYSPSCPDVAELLIVFFNHWNGLLNFYRICFSFERYVRICYLCQLRPSSLITVDNFKYYVVGIIIGSILFYTPKFFEVRPATTTTNYLAQQHFCISSHNDPPVHPLGFSHSSLRPSQHCHLLAPISEGQSVAFNVKHLADSSC